MSFWVTSIRFLVDAVLSIDEVDGIIAMICELTPSGIFLEKFVYYLKVIYFLSSLSQVVPEVSKVNGRQLLVDDKSKYKSMLIRAYSSIWMIGGFALIIYMGHLCITAMVVVIQIFMAKELFNLLRRAHEDRQLPGFRLLNWYLSQICCLTALLFVLFKISYSSNGQIDFLFLIT